MSQFPSTMSPDIAAAINAAPPPAGTTSLDPATFAFINANGGPGALLPPASDGGVPQFPSSISPAAWAQIQSMGGPQMAFAGSSNLQQPQNQAAGAMLAAAAAQKQGQDTPLGPDHPENSTLASQQSSQGVSADPYASENGGDPLQGNGYDPQSWQNNFANALAQTSSATTLQDLPPPAGMTALSPAAQTQIQNMGGPAAAFAPQSSQYATPADLQTTLDLIRAIPGRPRTPQQLGSPPPMPTAGLQPGQANAKAAITPGGIPLTLGPNTTLGGNWGNGQPLPPAPPSGPPPQPAGQVRDGSWVTDTSAAGQDPAVMATLQTMFNKSAAQVPGLARIGDYDSTSPNANAFAPQNPQGPAGSGLPLPVSQFPGQVAQGAKPTQLGPDPIAIRQAINNGLDPNSLSPAEYNAIQATLGRSAENKVVADNAQRIIQARALAQQDARRERMNPGYDNEVDRNLTANALQQWGQGQGGAGAGAGGIAGPPPAVLMRTNPAMYAAGMDAWNKQQGNNLAQQKMDIESNMANQMAYQNQMAARADALQKFRALNPTLTEQEVQAKFAAADPQHAAPIAPPPPWMASLAAHQAGQAPQGQPPQGGLLANQRRNPLPAAPQPQGPAGQPGQAPPQQNDSAVALHSADLARRVDQVTKADPKAGPEQFVRAIASDPSFTNDPVAVKQFLDAHPVVNQNDLDTLQREFDPNQRLDPFNGSGDDWLHLWRIAKTDRTQNDYEQMNQNIRKLRKMAGWSSNLPENNQPLPP